MGIKSREISGLYFNYSQCSLLMLTHLCCTVLYCALLCTCVGGKTMIYTENYKGRKKPCLALVSVGGGLGWNLSGVDLSWGRDLGNGNSELKMRSFQCSVRKHFIIRSEKSIWDENNNPGHQITVITLSARAPELRIWLAVNHLRSFVDTFIFMDIQLLKLSFACSRFDNWKLIVIMSWWCLCWCWCDAEGMYLYLWGTGAPSSDYVFMWPH